MQWPDDSSVQSSIVQTALSDRSASDLQVALKRVRASKQESGDYPEFYRILRGLHKTARQGVQFVTERVGSDVFITSLDADPGGAATLVKASSAGAHVQYKHGGPEAVVDAGRVCDISEIVTPDGVRTRSDAVRHGVEFQSRPEVEAAELTRWREALRESREAERAATERATGDEAAAEKAIKDAQRANGMIATARQYSRHVELQRDKAIREKGEIEQQSRERVGALVSHHSKSLASLRSSTKDLEKQLADTQAQLYRAVNARVETETFAAARIQTAEAKAEATVDEMKCQIRRAVDDAKAGTIDRMATLSGLADVLCPDSSIASMGNIDSLVTSGAATRERIAADMATTLE